MHELLELAFVALTLAMVGGAALAFARGVLSVANPGATTYGSGGPRAAYARARRRRRADHRFGSGGFGKRLRLLERSLTQGEVVRGEAGERTARGVHHGRAVEVCVPAPEDEGLRYGVSLSPQSDVLLTVSLEREGAATYRAEPGGRTPEGRARARQLVQHPSVRGALASLFMDLRVRELRLGDGAVSAVGPRDEFDLVPERAKRLLRLLTTIARTCERLEREPPPPITVASDEPRGLAGRQCPYCHDDLEAAPPAELVACEQCQTVLHGECLAEAGRCTALGCTGRRGLPLLEGAEEARRVVRVSLASCEECGSRRQGCRPGRCRARPQPFRRRWRT